MLTLLIVLAAEVGAIDTSVVFAGDIEMQATITGLYAMTIILVFMFLMKFLFDIAFVYAVSTVRVLLQSPHTLLVILVILTYFYQRLSRVHFSKPKIFFNLKLNLGLIFLIIFF